MRLFSLLLILLAGCVANNGLGSYSESNDNIFNLSRVDVGMTEKEVLQIMRHPYSQRSFEHRGSTYDVWFYVTRPSAIDQSRLLPQNLTPLTFKDGILIGWGYEYYNYLLKQEKIEQGIEKRSQQKEPPKEEEPGLEKVLQEIPKDKQPSKEAPPEKNAPAAAPSRKAAPKGDKQKEEKKTAPPSQSAPESSPYGPIPLQAPVQPTPSQPPPPSQPQSSIPPRLSFLSMCSRSSTPRVEDPPDQDQESAPTQDRKSSPKQEPLLDEEGDEMIEEENEQDFNFW